MTAQGATQRGTGPLSPRLRGGQSPPLASEAVPPPTIGCELSERRDALARYFQAKRRLADPAKMDKYTPDDCVAVMSVAMERDLFPWMQSLGLTVDKAKTKIPMEW